MANTSAESGRAQELYETAPVGLCWVNDQCVIIAMNQTLLNWLGYNRAEVIDRMSFEVLVSEGTRPQFHELRERCQRSQAVEEVDLHLRCHDANRWFQGRVSAVGVYDAQGGFRGWQGSIRDVRWERETQSQLIQMQTLDAIERLAAGIAHELNNLLQVIVGYADLGLERLEGNERHTSDFFPIKEAAFRAADIVQRLQTFNARQIHARQSLDLNQVILDYAATLRSFLPEHLELRLITGAERPRVPADAGSVRQLLINLVSNACRVVPRGGTLSLATRNVILDERYCQRHPATKPGSYVCLTATGMEASADPVALARVFEPVFGTEETARELRFSAIWGIVKQHEGHLEVSSSPDEGTIVRVYFPCERS